MASINISKKVLDIRNQKGYSQQKISDILGISRSFLSEVENGLAIPGHTFLLSFYKYLNVNINWLLTDRGEQYIEKETVVNDISQSSGERLKNIRKILKLTQQKMAIKLHITQGFLSSVESDRFSMGAEFLYELNRQLNVNINWLLAGDGPMFLSGLKLAAPVSPDVVDDSSHEERTNKLLEMIAVLGKDMTEEQLRDVLKYTEEKKRLSELEELTKGIKKHA